MERSAVVDSSRTLDSTSGLDDYLAYATAHNPALKAAHDEWRAAVAKSGYAGALMDPMFGYSYQVEQVETRVGPQEQRFSLRQSFPWPGTLGASRSVAERSADMAYQQFEARTLQLLYDIRIAYYELYSLGREIEITQANFDLLTFWEAVVRNRYRSSLSPHPDLMKVQVELAQLENKLISARAQAAPAVARLRSLLNLPDTTSLPLPSKISFSETALPTDSLIPLAEQTNPNLQAMTSAIRRAESGRTLASRSTRPEFSLGIEYIRTGAAMNPSLTDSGKDPWMISVGVTLPIWFGNNRAKREEAEAAWKASQYSYADTRNALAATVAQVAFEHQDALRSVRLYRDGLIPKAELVLEATYTAYQTDAADFLSLLDAQRQLFEFQLTLARSEAAAAGREAELEMLTGRDL